MLWLALCVFDVMLVSAPCTLCSVGLTLKQFLAIYGKVSNKQARRQISLLIPHGEARPNNGDLSIFDNILLPIMLALCSMLLATYYAQNYAGGSYLVLQ